MTLAPAPPPSLDAIELLAADEAVQVRDEVHALRPHWTRRHPGLPFFTLGAASYLDARTGGFEAYRDAARRLNPLLAERFGWLHGRLAAALADRLGAPVGQAEGLALPGFHIFLSHPSFRRPLASVHFDLQYELIDWGPFGDVDCARPLSMTLAIALPRSGAGLRLWDIRREELAGLGREARRELLASGRGRAGRVPYAPGRLVIHDGHCLHQMAPLAEPQPEDERITLQAHAVRAGERWLVYW